MTLNSSTLEEDFISLYLQYTAKTECPVFFHRWCALTSLAAYLGRNVYLQHGHFTLYPNLYTMLIGVPGTRKSSAIKISSKLLKLAGYNTFAAKKTRQEKFLLDLAELSEKREAVLSGGYRIDDTLDALDQNLWGSDMDSSDYYLNRAPAECYIAADEFNNFIGAGNIEFISILGELWDYEGVFDYRLKNSKSVYIPSPTINILGGNTPTGFSQAFSVETIGQGFFSRLLLVYGEPSNIKYTFPPSPDTELQNKLINILHKIKEKVTGEISISKESEELIDKIYKQWEGIDDLRFEHYANRRLTHLLKLCVVVTAARIGTRIEAIDVVRANTILTFTEQLMPKALGEFGKARHAETTHKLVSALNETVIPLTFQDMWKLVHNDLDNRNQLIEIISNLQVAEKIQLVEMSVDLQGTKGKSGYLPIRRVRGDGVQGAIDWNLLTEAERNMI